MGVTPVCLPTSDTRLERFRWWQLLAWSQTLDRPLTAIGLTRTIGGQGPGLVPGKAKLTSATQRLVQVTYTVCKRAVMSSDLQGTPGPKFLEVLKR